MPMPRNRLPACRLARAPGAGGRADPCRREPGRSRRGAGAVERL